MNSYLQFPAVGEKNRKQTTRGGKHTDFPPCIFMLPGIQQPSFPQEQISSLIPITSDTKPSPPVSSARKLGRKYKASISVTFRLNTLILRAPLHVFSVHACDYMGTSICAFIKMGIKAGDGCYSVAPHLTSLRQGPSLNRKSTGSARLPSWPASSPVYLSTTPPILGVIDMPWRFELRSSNLWSKYPYPLSHLTSSLFFYLLFLL